MHRWFVVGSAVALCFATVHTQTSKPAARPIRVIDPVELSGPPKPMPPRPSSALRRFMEGGAFKFDPKKPETVAPALRALNDLLKEEPYSDFYLMRALIGCYGKVDAKSMLGDIAAAMSARALDTESSPSKMKRDLYAFKAKVEFNSAQFQSAVDDLENAVKQDYEDAAQTFNDGGVKPRLAAEACVWTQADLNVLVKQLPKDYRPPLLLGLYLTYFSTFQTDVDPKPIFEAFDRSAMLNPTSPLPAFYTGAAYTTGKLGGIMSPVTWKCIDDITPRTEPCLESDELHRTGLRWLTKAIALDPTFVLAYAMRAEGSYRMKQYRQAIRDYDKVVELTPVGVYTTAHNGRGLAKLALGEYQSALVDLTKTIELGCGKGCEYSDYDNRAAVYLKLHDYVKELSDRSLSIKKFLSTVVFLMNINQFRQIYPEYDSVADDVLCEKLRTLFFPQMSYADYSKQFLIDAKDWDDFILPELYVKRGDAHAKLNQIDKANKEYDRVSRAFPKWAPSYFVERNGKCAFRPS